MRTFFGTSELIFLLNLGLSVALGAFIGLERELRNKDAGISTSVFIVAGAMLFTYISTIIDGTDSARIASQIVSGIGFIGAGLIIRDGSNIKNLTTAAGVWFMAAVGMAIGFQFYFVAVVGAAAAAFIPRIPYYRSVHTVEGESEHEKK